MSNHGLEAFCSRASVDTRRLRTHHASHSAGRGFEEKHIAVLIIDWDRLGREWWPLWTVKAIGRRRVSVGGLMWGEKKRGRGKGGGRVLNQLSQCRHLSGHPTSTTKWIGKGMAPICVIVGKGSWQHNIAMVGSKELYSTLGRFMTIP
jgi:hypothetical protein